MSRRPGQWRERIRLMAQKFREKGAISPESAMTSQQLGLPPRFEEAMKQRLGQTGIFVEVGGKYYLNEQRFREFEQRQMLGWARNSEMSSTRRNMSAVRIARMVLGILILSLILVNFLSGRILLVWIAIAVLIVVWICLSVLQIYYIANAGRTRQTWAGTEYPNVTIASNTSTPSVPA